MKSDQTAQTIRAVGEVTAVQQGLRAEGLDPVAVGEADQSSSDSSTLAGGSA